LNGQLLFKMLWMLIIEIQFQSNEIVYIQNCIQLSCFIIVFEQDQQQFQQILLLYVFFLCVCVFLKIT
jgi:hypothetical protein